MLRDLILDPGKISGEEKCHDESYGESACDVGTIQMTNQTGST